MKKIIYFFSLIIVLTSIKLSAQITSGLVAYYPFNGNANDESGNGHNGVVNGATLSTDRFGSFNKAFLFNGINNFIQVNNFLLLNDNFSYSAWIKINGNNSVNDLQSFSTLGPDGAHTWNFSYNNINKNWDLWDRSNNGWIVPFNVIGNTLNWTHIVITYSNNTEKLYIDNSLLNSRPISLPITLGGGNTLLLGANGLSNTQCFNGLIDDVRLYNRELTPAEIDIIFHENNIDLKLTVIQQGYYNSIANRLYKKDTVKVFIRQPISPYSIVDSALQIIDSVTFSGIFKFHTTPAGLYYLAVKHKNCIETWSSTPINLYSDSTVNYSFTTNITQAFGNNIVQVDASPVRFGIYSGDINQDGIIDAEDLSNVDNDAANFVLGYSLSDINGDNFVDASDISRVDNNIGKIAITP